MTYFSKVKYLLCEIIGIVLLIGIWFIVSLALNNSILPNPIDVISSYFALLGTELYWLSLGASLLRLTLSFALSALIALILGILAGLSRTLQALLRPLVLLITTLPIVIIIFVVLILFSESIALYLIVFVTTFPIIYEITYRSLEKTDPYILASLKNDGANNIQGFFRVRLPLIKDALLTGAFQSLAIGFKAGIMAESLTGSTRIYGLGKMIDDHASLSDMKGIFSIALTALLIMLVLDTILLLIRRFVIDKNPNEEKFAT